MSLFVYGNIAIASLVWAGPFIALGVYWMHAARKENDLGVARFARIAVRTLVLLLLLGSIGYLIIFMNQPGPDAGLAVGVGLASSLVGAMMVWVVSVLMAFAVLRTGPSR